jgi:hypothetical protein
MQGKEIGLHNAQQDAAIQQLAQKVQREQMLNPDEIRLIKQAFSSGTY